MKKQVTERQLYKFIVHKVKRIVTDPNGNIAYMEAFDRIIYNFYGVKHFSEKMSEMWDDREFAILINRVGLKNILTLIGYKKYYNALRELIIIDTILPKLRRKINHKQQKGKQDREYRDMIKEHRYLRKLYTKGEKALRKRLGIKGGQQSYKKRFGNIKSLVNEYHDRSWGGFSSIDGYDDYEDYDYDETSELDDFLAELKGVDTSKSRYHQENDSILGDSYDNDFSLFDDDGDDDGAIGQVEQKVDTISAKLNQLNDVISALASQSKYDKVNHRNPVTHQPAMNADNMRPNDMVMQQQLQQINSTLGSLTAAIGNIEAWRQNMDAILLSNDEDEEEEEYDSYDMMMDDPSFISPQQIQEKINKYPDVYQEQSKINPRQVVSRAELTRQQPLMSREELVDALNNDPPGAEVIPTQADYDDDDPAIPSTPRFAGQK